MTRRRGMLATYVQIQREAERDRERRARAAARSQREAERAAAARHRAAVQDQKLRDRLYAEERTREAAEDTAQVDQQVAVLQNVLAATLQVDDYLDLEALKQPPVYPRFDPGVAGAPPLAPRESDYAVAGPSGLGRVFGGSKHAARAEQRQAEYQRALADYQVASQARSDRMEQARRQHATEVERLQQDHRRHVEEISALQAGLAARRPESVVRYLDLVLETAQYPDGFPHSWRLDYVSGAGHLAIDYELPAVDVVPQDKGYKYVKSSDTITTSPRPVTQVRSIYAEVVRQTVLRVVHEITEADRAGVVRTIALNGYVNGTDPATGRDVRACLVALATSRERFLQLDLARVETVACLTHLEARVSKDPAKLLPVEPIVLAGTLDADFTLDTDEQPEPGAWTAPPSASDASPEVPNGMPPADRQELTAGQNVPIRETRLQIQFSAAHGDLSVLMIGAAGRVDRDEDFVFYNNPRSTDGAVTLTADGAEVAIELVAHRYEKLVLAISPGDSSSSLSESTATLHQVGGAGDYRFTPANVAGLTALVWGELYRRDGAWRFRAIGQGWSDGLAGLARDYGVNVD
jgi:restriction system protein